MAMLVDFTKILEDPDQVQYAFGLSQRMDRILVFDKRSRYSRPTDGNLDESFRAAYFEIQYWQQRLNYWPMEGSCAS